MSDNLELMSDGLVSMSGFVARKRLAKEKPELGFVWEREARGKESCSEYHSLAYDAIDTVGQISCCGFSCFYETCTSVAACVTAMREHFDDPTITKRIFVCCEHTDQKLWEEQMLNDQVRVLAEVPACVVRECLSEVKQYTLDEQLQTDAWIKELLAIVIANKHPSTTVCDPII